MLFTELFANVLPEYSYFQKYHFIRIKSYRKCFCSNEIPLKRMEHSALIRSALFRVCFWFSDCSDFCLDLFWYLIIVRTNNTAMQHSDDVVVFDLSWNCSLFCPRNFILGRNSQVSYFNYCLIILMFFSHPSRQIIFISWVDRSICTPVTSCYLSLAKVVAFLGGDQGENSSASFQLG